MALDSPYDAHKRMHVALIHWGADTFHAGWVVLDHEVPLDNESAAKFRETIREQALKAYEDYATTGRYGKGKEYQIRFVEVMGNAGPIRI